MSCTILHVEDDVALRAIVEMCFDTLGFRGRPVTAGTVEEAEQVLDDAARDGHAFDLIISDMHLPDGTGLDLVRYVRSSSAWRITPTLILSGDLNPKTVGLAYALGANAYIDKSPHDRSFIDVVRTLYAHWMKDVVAPSMSSLAKADRLQVAISRALSIRCRHAAIYQRLAEMFSATGSESAFWLSRALSESNLINLLGLLQRQPPAFDVDDDLADRIDEMQRETELRLTKLERWLDTKRPRTSVYTAVLDLMSVTDVNLIARSLGRVFPVVPVAVSAFRDFVAEAIDDVTAWIQLHADDPALRQRATEMRARVRYRAA